MNRMGAVGCLLCLAAAVRAETGPSTAAVGGRAELRLVSAYVWRGETITDEPCVQFSAALEAGHTTLSVWTTRNLTRVPADEEARRIDTTLSYTSYAEENILTVGAILYSFQKERPSDTCEVFFSYTLDVVALPTLAAYYDLGETDGLYGVLSFAHSFELVRDTLDLDIRLAVGGADEKYAFARFGSDPLAEPENVAYAPDGYTLIDLTASMDILYFYNDRYAFSAGVRFMSLLNPDLRGAVRAAGREAEMTAFSLGAELYF